MAGLAVSSGAQVHSGSDRDNATEQRNKPYVVLVGLDGFRSDYATKYQATRLQALGEEGAHASLIPVFPSTTFPSFYSIVTGLYPEHHGIVAMDFYDSGRRRSFHYSTSDAADGSWYGGLPIWVLAERQGMRTAAFFWIGSDAQIAGTRPSAYVPWDGKISDEARADQVIAWLKLPPERRPHLITVYFSDVDEAGHRYGPDSPQTRDAVQRLDRLVGGLADGIRGLHLPVNLLVVSDHGMIRLKHTPIVLADYLDPADLPDAKKNDLNTFNLYADSPQQAERWYKALKGRDSRFEVYRRAEVPADLHYSANPRIGDIVVIPTEPAIVINEKAPGSALAAFFEKHSGSHGFPPRRVPEMAGIFYAVGPNIKTGMAIPPVEGIEIYPLVANILSLSIEAPIDARGTLASQIIRP